MEENIKRLLDEARAKTDALYEWLIDNNKGVLTSAAVIELWHNAIQKRQYFYVRLSLIDERKRNGEDSSIVYQEQISTTMNYDIDALIEKTKQFVEDYLKQEDNGI